MNLGAMATAAITSLSTSDKEARRWKNPNEVVKMRKKLSRKPSRKDGRQNQQENAQSDIPSVIPAATAKRSIETAGITACIPLALKKQRSLVDISNSPLKHKENYTKPPPVSLSQLTSATPTRPLSVSTMVPLDWTLKTKIRFISPFPFSWSSSLKPQQEALGVTRFIRNVADNSSSDPHVLLQQCLMVWTHPSLPFIKTFPRGDSKQTATQQISLFQDEEVVQSLRDDWSTSLYSAYQLLKAGHCQYFYVCAHQFTALFLASGVCDSSTTAAMITPTTSGMREALKREGAEFSLPLAPDKAAHDPSDEFSDMEDDASATTWLSSMGLPVRDFPALDPQKIALQQTREATIDSRPESVVRVEGPSVHALFNFLLTSKTTVSTSGSHAGLPPTILAPVGFRGATLKSHKLRQGSVQERGGDEMVRRYFLEVSGSILPQSVHNLCQLLEATQHGEFTAHMTNLEPSGAFNAGWEHRGSTVDDHSSLLHQTPLGNKTGMKELKFEDSGYSWH